MAVGGRQRLALVVGVVLLVGIGSACGSSAPQAPSSGGGAYSRATETTTSESSSSTESGETSDSSASSAETPAPQATGPTAAITGPSLRAPYYTAPKVAYDFGDVTADETSPVAIFSVSNATDYPVRIDVRTNDGRFGIVEDGCSKGPVSPSAQCRFGVVFRPNESGALRTAVLAEASITCSDTEFVPCSYSAEQVRQGYGVRRQELPSGDVLYQWNALFRVVAGRGVP